MLAGLIGPKGRHFKTTGPSPASVRTGVSLAVGILLVVSSFAAPASADNSSFALKVNFGSQTTTAPAGYQADYGQSFSSARGFGWQRLDGAPVSLVGNGREWNKHSDKRLDSYMHLAYSGSPTVGTRIEGRWVANVPNGLYNITTAVGDPSYTDSHHVLRAEGKVLADFRPTASNTHSTTTTSVNVTDGQLTVDQVGGTNTKINYIEVLGAGTAGSGSEPPAGEAVVKQVNFGTSSTAAPAGYVADSGQAFTTQRGYGWLTTGGAALDLSMNGRERNAVSDKRLDSLMHMNFNGPTGGTRTEGKWELLVPNGTYNVTVGVGDPSYTDSSHVVRAEAKTVVSLTLNATTKSRIGTTSVAVADGKLTLDQTGGTNTKINFVTITKAATGSEPLAGEAVVKQVNFGTSSTAAPAGYVADSGQAFTTQRGYGWLTTGGATLDLSINARERNAVSDKRLDSLMHMNFNGPTGGIRTEGKWELVVPNGTYNVTVGVGDPSYTDSSHVVRAEAKTVVSLAPNATTKSRIGTTSVTVADGKLTLDQTGGTNTKINFVTVTKAATGSEPPAGEGSMQIAAPQDFLGLGNRMVFSTVRGVTNPEQTLMVQNTGNAALNVTSLAISGPNSGSFQLAAGQATNFSVTPGTNQPVRVRFTPSAGEVHQASLTIRSNSSTTPSRVVSLGGMNATDFEDVHEPSLQAIVNAAGYQINAGVTFESTNFISDGKAAVGDEILASYFRRADTSKPVELHPLANYSGRSTAAKGPFGLHTRGSTSAQAGSYSFPGGSDIFGGQNQKMFPTITGGSVNFVNPGTSFGVRDGTPGEVSFTDDALNGVNQPHNMRLYPAKNPAGQTIANTFVVGVDLGHVDYLYKNWDYQDYVFLIKNVIPEAR